MKPVFKTSDLAIDKTGSVLVTEQLQKLIDLAAQNQGIALVEKGTYLTASLFLKSHMELRLEEGAELLGTTDESCYPVIPTRAAGIEMDWYPGIVNINNQTDVTVSGKGTINGQGEYWWNKYWGTDQTGGYRKEYDAKRLQTGSQSGCYGIRPHYTERLYLDPFWFLECSRMLQLPRPCRRNSDYCLWFQQSKYRRY